MKIWFLTRSLYPYQKTGGGQIRLGQVNNLISLGWNVTVVMPSHDSNELINEDKIIQVPFKKTYSLKLASIGERLGIYEDYLDKWVEDTFKYLKDKVKENDLIFATSGGELGMIKLASLLKDHIGSKIIANFHDPLDYSFVNNLKLDKKFHISREKQEYKYLKNADLILTSSKANQGSLINKYPILTKKIHNNYFGYIEKLKITGSLKADSKKLRIAYVGNMGPLQKPENLFKAFSRLTNKDNIELYFIGDVKNNKELVSIRDKSVKLISSMPHKKFLDFMAKNIDVGFVTLTSNYLGACVPSKIYEYINLGLPMIAALPDGDGKNIINSFKYGIACEYNNLDGIVNAIEHFRNQEYLNKQTQNIIKDRDLWDMKEKIKDVDLLIKGIVNDD